MGSDPDRLRVPSILLVHFYADGNYVAVAIDLRPSSMGDTGLAIHRSHRGWPLSETKDVLPVLEVVTASLVQLDWISRQVRARTLARFLAGGLVLSPRWGKLAGLRHPIESHPVSGMAAFEETLKWALEESGGRARFGLEEDWTTERVMKEWMVGLLES